MKAKRFENKKLVQYLTRRGYNATLCVLCAVDGDGVAGKNDEDVEETMLDVWADALNRIPDEDGSDDEDEDEDFVNVGSCETEIDDMVEDVVVGSDDEDMWVAEAIDYTTTISEIMDDYGIEQSIFTESELDDMKRKEKALIERGVSGYYRNKVEHREAYDKIVPVLQPYLTIKNFRMLHHQYNTQSNKALNKSVSAYAPKDKNYSLTRSLEARVGVTAAIQIQGYEVVWEEIHRHFNANYHLPTKSALSKLDKAKNKKRDKAKTKEGKKKRSQAKYKKLTDAHNSLMRDQKLGITYSTGVAMRTANALAKAKLSSDARNSEGTRPEEFICRYYHPQFCQRKGHKTAMNKACGVFGWDKKDRKNAEKVIFESTRNQILAENSEQRKCFQRRRMTRVKKRKVSTKSNFVQYFILHNYLANEEREQRTVLLRNGYKKI